MQLNDNERLWAPMNHPEYLCLLRNQQQPPQDQEQFLLRQADLLERLLEEADEGEKEACNRQLVDNLQPEFLDFLPTGLLMNPRTPSYLLNNPAVEGSPLHRWKAGFRDFKSLPPHPKAELLELAEGLSLESWLSRLL